jgi:exonuclease SbcD
MISGNHDSPEKIGYGSALFRRNGIHIAGRFDGAISPIRVDDRDGRSAEVFLIPFIRPFVVKRRFPDADIKDYTDAMRTILESSPSMGLDFKVAVAHQFVTSTYGDPSTCESEDPRIGDVDSMDVSVFDSFDYVALGHLHTPQHVGRETVRYCGTPLKYSASEVSMDKTVTIIEMDDEIRIREVPLVPLRDVRKVKGKLEDIIDAAKSEPNRDDLIYVELTEETVNAMERIRQVYPNTLHIKVIRPDNSGYALPDIDDIRALDPMEVFEEMYKRSRGEEMTDEQRRIVRGMMEDSGVRF